MAGHNKWSKVKHIKGAADAKRGRIFSKLSREITLAARDGADEDLNPRLRQAVLAAKAQNMPGDTIERAIKKGTGGLEGQSYEETLYEAYGPAGAALLIEAVTDNRNRTAADIRHILSKNNGTWADAGSVAYQFERKGHIEIQAGDLSEERLLAIALDHGLEDIESAEDGFSLTTTHNRLFDVVDALRENQLEPSVAELTYQAQNIVPVTDPDDARKLVGLWRALDDCDDTQNLHGNFELPADLEQEIDHPTA